MLRRVPLGMVLAFVILHLTVEPALHAQQASPEVPPITFRTNTRLVLVDVVVTDKKGQPVTSLKAEDFTVEENGKKQKSRKTGRSRKFRSWYRPGLPLKLLPRQPPPVSSPITRSTSGRLESPLCCFWTPRILRSKNKPTDARKC